jgi:cyanophycinase
MSSKPPAKRNRARSEAPKPLYLLADSQLLFWKKNNSLFIGRVLEDMEPDMTGAAYIGASNGDEPAFYELFHDVMKSIGVTQCRLVPSQPSGTDLEFLEEAGLVLLAGGDAEKGWRTMEQNEVTNTIKRKRYDGTVMVGISAGAIQLGLGLLSGSPQPQIVGGFAFAPFYLGAHEENEEWRDLRALVHLSPANARGIGIAAGGGVVYYSDGTLEPVRKSCIEFSKEDGVIKQNVLLPPG